MRPSRAGFSNANKCPRSFTAERSDANLLSFLVKMYFLSYGYVLVDAITLAVLDFTPLREK